MIIFSPGPANISERVRKALLRPDICHRDTEFEDLLSNSKELLLDIFKAKNNYKSILFGGSGTSAIESVIASFGGYGKKILIVSNGVYGERALRIAETYNIAAEELKFKWGSYPDLKKIESSLKGKDVGAIYIVHHETTTGLLNPLKEISQLADRHGKLVLVDAVSSLGGEALDIAGWNIDAAICSSNKCIRGIPGISFVIASDRLLKILKKCKGKSFYTDMLSHLNAEEKKQTPFTPPVQAFYAFLEALEELKEEGLENRIKCYEETANVLRAGLKNLGITFLIPEKFMSSTMTVVHAPKGHSYTSLHDEFKKRGFVIYASQGELSKNTFRLGTVGLISKSDIERFLKVFKGIL